MTTTQVCIAKYIFKSNTNIMKFAIADKTNKAKTTIIICDTDKLLIARNLFHMSIWIKKYNCEIDVRHRNHLLSQRKYV